MAQHRPCLARAKHVTVIDAVRPERHRRDQRHHLAPWLCSSGPIAEINRPVDQRLDPEPVGEHRRKQHAGVRDRPLIIENHPHRVRQTVHHMGDLLLQARRRPTRQLSACSGGHSNLGLGRLPTNNGCGRDSRCWPPPAQNRVDAELTLTPPTPPGVRVRTGRFAEHPGSVVGVENPSRPRDLSSRRWAWLVERPRACHAPVALVRYRPPAGVVVTDAERSEVAVARWCAHASTPSTGPAVNVV